MLVSAFCSFVYLATTPFADETCETNFSLRSSWKEDSGEFFSHRLELVSTCHLRACEPCMGVHQATLIVDAKQTTSEGKSGPVETELTGLAATTL